MAIGDPYISKDALKSVLRITSTEEDDFIERCVRGASKALERRAGWPTFWNTGSPVTRTVDVTRRVVPVRNAGWQYTKVLLRDGIASASGFTVSGFSAPVLLPADSIEDGTPADAIRLPWGASFGSNGTLSVTAVFGWPEVPADILWAAQMQAQRYYGRKGSPEGVAGSAEWGLTRIPALDPDVLSILKGGGFMRAGIG